MARSYKSDRRFSRRTMLRGMLGGAVITVGLPPLEIMMNAHGTAYADSSVDGFPKRFGIFAWGNGMLPDRWVPTGEGEGPDAWELSEQLQPLADLRGKFSVVTGMRVGVPNIEPHFATACGILTGGPLIKKGGDWTFGGPTLDQIVAAEIGQATRFASLEFGAKSGAGLSYNGPNSQNPPEQSPHALFDRVFGGGFTLPGDNVEPDPSIGLRLSLLDVVKGDVDTLKKSVGAADKQRLEQHFEGLRALELRLEKLLDPPQLAACAYPPEPEAEYPDIEGRPQLKEKNRAMCDTVALALACDQTRVFSNWFTRPVTNTLFQGSPAGHHQLTHDEPGDQPEVHKITLQCVEEMAYQMKALDAIEEGEGTLLDHSIVFGTSDVSLGKTHSQEDFPIVIAGGAGALKMDVHYRSPASENASKVLLSMVRAMGLELSEFGAEDGLVSEGLSEIER